MAKKKKKDLEEGEELQDKKGKKGKKKLLLVIPVLAAAAAAVIFLDIGGLGSKLGFGKGDSSEEEVPEDPGVYTIEGDTEETQDTTISLDSILEEGEGVRVSARGPEEVTIKSAPAADASGSASTSEEAPEEDEGVTVLQSTYIYDVSAPSVVVGRYLDAVLGGEEDFSLIDDTNLVQDERPELTDSVGAVKLARPSVREGHLFQIVIGWSEASSLTVRVSVPEGALQYPAVDRPVLDPASLPQQMDQLKAMSPSELGLPGDSMDEYEIYPGEGFVMVDGTPCRKFNIYRRQGSGEVHYTDIVGIFLFSGDQQHIYRLDTDTNVVTTLK